MKQFTVVPGLVLMLGLSNVTLAEGTGHIKFHNETTRVDIRATCYKGANDRKSRFLTDHASIECKDAGNVKVDPNCGGPLCQTMQFDFSDRMNFAPGSCSEDPDEVMHVSFNGQWGNPDEELHYNVWCSAGP